MTDRERTLLAVVALSALVLVSAVAAPLASARPAHEIPVTEFEQAQLQSPEAADWNEVPAADIPLASAPSSVPNADQTSIEQIHVQAATSGDRLYLRLQWHDVTRDVRADDPRTFADAVAVQFPVNTSNRPPIAMGGERNMVNVWYWSGDVGTQELLAGGPGTTTPFQNPVVTANATHSGSGANASWTVVYSRDLQTQAENRTTISRDDEIDVAFAVWNGSNAERSGQKSVSEWYYFPFDSETRGPPYETLLWSIAGIAIVAVVAVTAIGVQRARGGMR